MPDGVEALLDEVANLVEQGGAGSRLGRTRTVLFHFTSSGIQPWVCDADYYLVAVSASTATGRYAIAGHNMLDTLAGDIVSEVGRWMVWANLSPTQSGFRIRYNKGESIYVRNITGGEAYITIHIEIIDEQQAHVG